jgi:hypothetical protein
MAKIAVLGWGSLIYHPEGDPGRGQKPLAKVGDWDWNGPILPLEFSRISLGRHLTLVIDPAPGHGEDNVTFMSQSARTSLDAAAKNLCAREGCSIGCIGRQQKTDPAPVDGPALTIRSWLAQTDFDGVVWTALPPKFLPGQKYTITAAVAYLEQLKGEERRRAFHYLVEAPDSISTPLRKEARWPEAVATHEAGHFLVAYGLDHTVLRLSRVKVDDRPDKPATIGCRYADMNDVPVIERRAAELAGAWAQVLHAPESIAKRKLPTFKNNILLPADEFRSYSWTGWCEDLKPVVQNMAMPPAKARAYGFPSPEAVERLNQRMKAFFCQSRAKQAVVHIREALMSSAIIHGSKLDNLRAAVNAIVPPAHVRQALFGTS